MKGANYPALEVGLPAVRVEERLRVGERCRDRVDREVPAVEILLDRRRADLRQGAGCPVTLGPGPGDVNPYPVDHEVGGLESLMYHRLRIQVPPQLRGVEFGGKIDVQRVFSEQDVSHRTADKVQPLQARELANPVENRAPLDESGKPGGVGA